MGVYVKIPLVKRFEGKAKAFLLSKNPLEVSCGFNQRLLYHPPHFIMSSDSTINKRNFVIRFVFFWKVHTCVYSGAKKYL